MATYNFTFAIPSSDLTGIALNNSATNTYQVATTYGNGNVVSSASSNKVVVNITMTDIDQNDVRLSTFGMTCSFQDNTVALDSVFTKIGTSPTSTTISSQVGGNTPLVGTPITFNYSTVVDANLNPYLQVIGTMTTKTPLYGKFWAKNVFPGKIKSIISSNYFNIVLTEDGAIERATEVNTVIVNNYNVNDVNPNPSRGALNIIYPVKSSASNPLINQNASISATTVSLNNLEIVGTTKANPVSSSVIQEINVSKVGNVYGPILYKLPPNIF
jgi:hypothetical protein